MNDKIKELGAEALSHFEVRERYGKRIVVLHGNAPFWVHQLVRHANDEWLDDWRCSFVLKSLASIESGDIDGSELEPSIYTNQLTSWLASCAWRVAYCDAARKKYGLDCDTSGLLQAGQLCELREVHALVRQFLEDMVLGDEHALTFNDFS